MEWKPIEESPHGVEVLLYIPGTPWGGPYMDVGCVDAKSTMAWHGSATHWMPLPDAPEPTESQQGLIPIPDGYAEQ